MHIVLLLGCEHISGGSAGDERAPVTGLTHHYSYTGWTCSLQNSGICVLDIPCVEQVYHLT